MQDQTAYVYKRVGQSKHSPPGYFCHRSWGLLEDSDAQWRRGSCPLPAAAVGCLPSGPQIQETTQAGVGNTSCAVACGTHWDRWANGRTQLGPPHFLPRGEVLLTFLRPHPQNNTPHPPGTQAAAPAAASNSGDIGQAGPSSCHHGACPAGNVLPPAAATSGIPIPRG